MTIPTAVIKAAATLGKAQAQFIRLGWRAIADECQEAIIDLQQATEENKPIFHILVTDGKK